MPAERIAFSQLARRFPDLVRQAHLGWVSLSSTGFYRTPHTYWNAEPKTGRPFYYFAYGGTCSEVMIDITTGETKVLRDDILHDVGRSLNPALDRSKRSASRH